MEPVTLTLLALAVGAATVAVAAVTLNLIIGWFQARTKVVRSYRNAIGFTIAERINGDQYATISEVFGPSTASTMMLQGIYDTEDGRVIDARKITSTKHVDDDRVLSMHKEGKGLVIYS